MTMNTARPVSTECPFWERHVTLGRMKDGVITFAQNKGEKREMLKTAYREMETDEAVFFIAWTGQWRTDLFSVTVTNLIDWLTES
jgi:hypothetical protein